MSKTNNIDIRAFYEKYKLLVFLNCYKYLKNKALSEDATSEIFQDLIENPEKLEDVRDFKKWLPVIVRNKCLRDLKKSTRHEEKKEDYLATSLTKSVFVDEIQLAEKVVDKNNFLLKLSEGLNSLKDKYRICIKLHYLDNKSYKEIIDITGFSFRQVDNYIYYGKKKLVQYFDKQGVTLETYKQLFD